MYNIHIKLQALDACDRSLTFFCTFIYFSLESKELDWEIMIVFLSKYVGIQKDDIQNIASCIEHW